MEDIEHLAKALNELKQAILADSNALGVDNDEYWLRAALIVPNKLGYRIRRFMEEKGTNYAFLFPLLAGLKDYACAQQVYVDNFFAQERDNLEADIRSLGMYCRGMSGSGILPQTLLEPMLEILEQSYGVGRDKVIADVEEAAAEII